MVNKRKEQEPEVLTKIEVILYKPISELPITHQPLIKFEGKVLSMREVSIIEFNMRKALRRFKNEEANRLNKLKGDSENANT
jgi:hypothetical protein